MTVRIFQQKEKKRIPSHRWNPTETAWAEVRSRKQNKVKHNVVDCYVLLRHMGHVPWLISNQVTSAERLKTETEQTLDYQASQDANTEFPQVASLGSASTWAQRRDTTGYSRSFGLLRGTLLSSGIVPVIPYRICLLLLAPSMPNESEPHRMKRNVRSALAVSEVTVEPGGKCSNTRMCACLYIYTT